MFSKHFVLNEQTLAIIEKFGEQMPNMNGHEAARRNSAFTLIPENDKRKTPTRVGIQTKQRYTEGAKEMTPLEIIKERKIVAIVRGLKPEYLLRLGHALAEGGIGLMEVTYNQREPESWKDTARGIEALAAEFGDRLLAGAGTVIRPEQVRMTYEAGGRYLVTPATQPEIIRMGKALGLGLFPGALTPTEILAAFDAGADAVKVFPASALGPGYIKAVRAPLSHIPLMAVGGVNEKNAAEYMKAGCVGLGVGGNLVNREWIENGEWGKITALAKDFMKAVNEA